MEASNIVSIVASVVILAAIVVYIYFKYKKSNDEKAKKALNDFEDNIKNDVEKSIVDYIDKTDFSKFNGLTDAQTSILNNLYNTIWDLVTSELLKVANTDPLTATLIKKVLTRENVENFVKVIFNSYKPQTAFAAKYDANLESSVKEALALENKTAKEGRAYDEGTMRSEYTKTVYDENQEKEEAEKTKLNPPKDEGTEVYSSDDDSIEVLGEPEDKDTKYIDAMVDNFSKEEDQ